MVQRLDYDVVIVGLGPAGASLAYKLRNSGLRIAGIDLVGEDMIWGKPCGDAIGKHHIVENNMPEPTGEALANNVEGIYVYSPSEKIRLSIPGEGYMINRNAYGRMLLNEASKKGVDVFLETYVNKLLIEDGVITGVGAKKLKNGEEIIFKAKVVVDATGTSAVLRRKTPKEWPTHELLKPVDMNVAYRRIVELGVEIEDPSWLRIYVNMDIAPGGYWWLFPKSSTIANIGLGVQGGRGYKHPRIIYDEILMKRPDVGSQKRVFSDAGAAVPTRRPANTLAWDNFIGIGDNGFTVNPVHGGGMGYAMTAASHAAQAIVEAFEVNDFSRYGPLWKTNLLYMRGLGAKQAGLDIFRIYLQELDNDTIEFALERGIFDASKAYYTSSEGEIDESVKDLLRKVFDLLAGGRLGMLRQLITVSDYMKKVKALYKEYPENPDDLGKWVERVEALYKEYKQKLGITW